MDLKIWLEHNTQWLVKYTTGGCVRIKDTQYPFSINSSWLNLLCHASYEDIVNSDRILNLLKKGVLVSKVDNLPSILQQLRKKPNLIPQFLVPESKSKSRNSGTWVLKKIPKEANFYWGASCLSFLRFMSLYSFRKFNPDWKINLYVPKRLHTEDSWKKAPENFEFTGKDYSKHLIGIGVKIIPFDFKSIGISNKIPEVYKSDILQWHLLGTDGGVWIDTDVLFFKPMENFEKNTSKFSNHSGFVSLEVDNLHTIGFVMASKENQFFKRLFSEIVSEYKVLRKKRAYQVFGSDFLDVHYPTLKSINDCTDELFGDVGFACVYPFRHMHYYYLYIGNGISGIHKNTIGVHWYAGNPHARRLIYNLNADNYLTFSGGNTIVNLLQKYFPRGIRA